MKKPKIRKPEPEFLVLEPESIRELKPPKPKTEWRLQQERNERWHYLETRRIGGLVPDHHGAQYWACATCHAIYEIRQDALSCHRGAANQVQICNRCLTTYRKLYRIGECRCSSERTRSPAQQKEPLTSQL